MDYVFNAGAIVNFSIWSSSWLARIHLKMNKKLRNSIFSPIFSPTIFDKPTSLFISNIPSNNLNSLASRKLLILGIYSINSCLINKEISINWNYCDYGAIIKNLLFDVLLLFWYTIVSDFMFLTWCSLFFALFDRLKSIIKWKTFLINNTINFCII